MAMSSHYLTLGEFLSTLRLRHLEAVILQPCHVGSDDSSLTVDSQVYFELFQSDSVCQKQILRSEFVTRCYDGLLRWDQTPSMTDALCGSPIACPVRRLSRFSIAFYSVPGNKLPSNHRDKIDTFDKSARRLLLSIADLQLARDLRRPPTLPSASEYDDTDLRRQEDLRLPAPRRRSLYGQDCVTTDDSLATQMSASAARVALRFKGIYLFVAPETHNGLKLSTSRCHLSVELASFNSSGRTASYSVLSLRRLLGLDVKSIDLERTATRLRSCTQSALAEQSSSESLEILMLNRQVLHNRLSSLANWRHQLEQLRGSNAQLNACIAELRQSIEAAQEVLERSGSDLAKSRTSAQSLRLQLAAQRAISLTELRQIFRLGNQGDSIAGVSLQPPLSGCWLKLTKSEEKLCAAAYGLTAQMVTLTGAVIDCPLRHAVILCGSKSLIRDDLTPTRSGSADEATVFPLYRRAGKDRSGFGRAALLLNLNIYGLACSCRVTTPADWRATALKNLSQLFDHLLDPSRAPRIQMALPSLTAAAVCRSTELKYNFGGASQEAGRPSQGSRTSDDDEPRTDVTRSA